MATVFKLDVPVGMAPRQAAHELIYRLSGVLTTTSVASHGRTYDVLKVRTSNGHEVRWGEHRRVVEIAVSVTAQPDEVERVRLEVGRFNERYSLKAVVTVSLEPTPARGMTDVLSELWLDLTEGRLPTWHWVRGDATNGAVFWLGEGVFYVYEDSRRHCLVATSEGLTAFGMQQIENAADKFNRRCGRPVTRFIGPGEEAKAEGKTDEPLVLIHRDAAASAFPFPGMTADVEAVSLNQAKERARQVVESLPRSKNEIFRAQQAKVEQAHLQEVRRLIRACLPEAHEGQAVLDLMARTVRAEVLNTICVITFPDYVWELAKKLQRVYPLPVLETGVYVNDLPMSPAGDLAEEVVRMHVESKNMGGL